jgi:pre-mRNA-splicing factor ATP-dependent RNA helicase DHX38/PRP16
VPEIQRTNLGNVVLLLKSLGVKDLLAFDFMDAPPQENMVHSMYQLWIAGALDAAGELTALGRKMVEFPLDPPLCKMTLMGEQLGCGAEIITVVAMLSVPTVFFRPRDREEQADQAREKLFVPESDHLTLLNIYQQWKTNGYKAEWCSEHFIQAKAMRKVREVRTQLADIAKQQGFKLESCGSDWDRVRRAICAAYLHNVARLKSVSEYVNLRSGMPCHLHPTSALYGLGYTPDHVVYHELIYTTKEYMQCVTAIDPLWLVDAAPALFTLKDASTPSYQKKKEEREDLERMEEEMADRLEEEAFYADRDKRLALHADARRSAAAAPPIARPGAPPPKRGAKARFGL